MPKTGEVTGDSARRSLPAVERVLTAPSVLPLIAGFGRLRVKEAVVEHLETLRRSRGAYDEEAAVDAFRQSLEKRTTASLRRVINGSGIIIHTNLGRCPIDPSLWADAAAIVTGYSNLEFDLAEGERGARDEHLTELCRSLFGCEAALLANNNAAATLLLLAATAAGREVIVSRGELVEIGGAFRVPDVIQQGGARLREVGTTNRTRARDYADAVTKKAAALLRVHRSNFEVVGFTETPELEDLVEVARAKRLPLLYDEGSGRVVDIARYGFAPRATLREIVAAGVDAVTCSTDKLLGATQGGLILGRAEIIDKCRRHPLMRALRAGKESYAVIAETLRAFATGKHEERIPIYGMLSLSMDTLRERAGKLIAGTSCRIVESDCALGGGTTPTETIPSIAIEIPGHAAGLQSRFLAADPPIVGRVQNDRFTIDVRTVLESDLPAVRKEVERA